MLKTIKKIFSPQSGSAQTAKNRLQLVLARDRIGVQEANIDELKSDLYQVISKYFDIDPGSLEIEIFNQDGRSALTVNTTVNRQMS